MKRKLLFAALCVVSALGFKANAQDWVGNAPAEGTFFLYNVEAKKFINNGDPNQSWGTNAYLQAGFGLDIKLENATGDNAYNLNTQVSNGGNSYYLGTSTWCDGGATPWTFTAVAGLQNTYMIGNGDKCLVANEAGNDIEYAASTGDARSYWKLVSLDDFKAAMEAKAYSTSDPMDVSVFIQARSFARNDLRNSKWVTSHNGGNWAWIGAAEDKYYGNEAWNNTFNVHQDISDLPDGMYEVQCSGFGTNGTAYVFGNKAEGKLQTDNSTGYGTDKQAKWKAIHEDNAFAGQSSGTFFVSDGKITLGVKREENKSGDWCVWDEFRLYYYGLDPSSYLPGYKQALKDAQALATEEDLASSSALTNLNNKISTYSSVDENSAQALKNATAALNDAMDLANAYLIAKPILAEMKKEVDATNFFTAEGYETYYGQWAAKFDDGTLTLAEAQALQNPSVGTDWHASITVDNFLLSAWDTNPDFNNAPYYINSWSTEGNGDGSNFRVPFFEYWTDDANSLGVRTLSGTMTELPAGYYKVTAWVRVRANNNNKTNPTGISMQLGESLTTDVTKGTQVGTSQFYLDEYTVYGKVEEDGKLVVKFNVEEGNTISWLSFKNVKYATATEAEFTKYHNDVLAAEVAEAEALNGKIPTAAYTELQGVVTANNKSYSTSAEYVTAIEAINNATQKATPMVAPYAEWLSIKATAEQLIPVANDNAAANTNLKTAYNTQKTAVDALDLSSGYDAISAATTALKEACITYVFAAKPVGDAAKFDVTFLMTNPDLTGLPTWKPAAGWASDYKDGNSQVMVNDSKTNGDYSYFYEYWSNPAKDGGVFSLYNTVKLPAGTFTMNCYAFAEDQYTDTKNSKVFFYANDTQGSNVASEKLTAQELKFINEEDQDVKIGLKTLSGNTYNWMGIGYVQLYKVPASTIPYAIDTDDVDEDLDVTFTVDGEEIEGEALPFKTVTMTVDMKELDPDVEFIVSVVDENEKKLDVASPKAGVFTFQMPVSDVAVSMSLPIDEVDTYVNSDYQYGTFVASFDYEIPEDATAYYVEEAKGTTLVLTELTTDYIPANQPVIIEATEMSVLLEGDGPRKAAKNVTKEGYLKHGLLYGVLEDTEAPIGSYVLQNLDGETNFYHVEKPGDGDDPIVVPANHAFLQLPTSSAKVIAISGDDEDATAIKGFAALTGGYDAIYNAAGQKVNALQKGANVVVKGGKSYKIFVK